LNRSLVGALLLLALAFTVVAYAPGLAGGFVFDDFPNILRNAAIRDAKLDVASLWEAALSSPSSPLSRPIASLSFALQIALQGLSAPAMKTVNLAIHLANGALLFTWVSLLLAAPRIAATMTDRQRQLLPLVVMALWLAAPIHLTAVLYVVQRMESLSALFTLAGLALYTCGRLRMEREQGGRFLPFAGLLGMTVLATLTKETGVLTPLYALLTELLGFGFRSRGRRDGALAIFFLLTCVLPGILAIALTLPDALSGKSYAARPFTLAQRLWTEGRILWEYLGAILLPRLPTLSLYHDDYSLSQGWLTPPTTLLAWAGLLFLLALAIALRRRAPLISLGIGIFFLGHALVSTYLPLELYHEHRNYLPAAGIFLALVAAGQRLAPRMETPRVLLFAFAGLYVLQAGTTFLRASEWSDPVRLAYFEASRHPGSLRANYELGLMLSVVSQGPADPRHGLALASFREAARLPGESALPLQALIFTAARHRQPIPPSLWAELEQAVAKRALSAADEGALFSLVDCVANGVCPLELAPALRQVFDTAILHHPDNPALYTMAARLRLVAGGEITSAERLMQRAVAIAPTNAQLWLSLAQVQALAGERERARLSVARSAEFDRLGRLARGRTDLLQRLESQP
jgi:hypothetical protein